MPNIGITNPHLAVPFRFSEGSAVCVEQDSEDDVAQCVGNILRTPRGTRLEIPEFGIPPIVLEESGPVLEELRAAIKNWEPRAEFTLSKKELEDILSSVIEIKVGKSPNG